MELIYDTVINNEPMDLFHHKEFAFRKIAERTRRADPHLYLIGYVDGQTRKYSRPTQGIEIIIHKMPGLVAHVVALNSANGRHMLSAAVAIGEQTTIYDVADQLVGDAVAVKPSRTIGLLSGDLPTVAKLEPQNVYTITGGGVCRVITRDSRLNIIYTVTLLGLAAPTDAPNIISESRTYQQPEEALSFIE